MFHTTEKLLFSGLATLHIPRNRARSFRFIVTDFGHFSGITGHDPGMTGHARPEPLLTGWNS